MAAPKYHICYGSCEKEVFDAKNAQIVAGTTVKSSDKCPDLTAAQITTILQDVETKGKGEEVTKECPNSDRCTCQYGPQPPFGAYVTMTLHWHAECKVGKRECKYSFDVTVDTASVTVTGKCKSKPGAPKPEGKTQLPPVAGE